MKKTISNIFDEANASEIDDLVCRNDARKISADTLSSVKSKVYAKTNIGQTEKISFFRLRSYVAVAACLILIISAILFVPMLKNDSSDIIPSPDTLQGNTTSSPDTLQGNTKPHTPIVIPQTSISAPKYYGSEESIGFSEPSGYRDPHPGGLSVMAELVQTLPDTYTFIDDWKQSEFRLLHMKTVELLKGQEITKEFYYVIPVSFMTDFSIFDAFVMRDMGQFSLEYSVVYNKTQDKTEELNLVVFGYVPYPTWCYQMGSYLLAFDADGNFDRRLWDSNENWQQRTQKANCTKTLSELKEEIQKETKGKDTTVQLLSMLGGEKAEALAQIKGDTNGIFVPLSNSLHFLSIIGSNNFSVRAIKYIGGFATNEFAQIWKKGHYSLLSKARFDENDMNALPDLAYAYSYVVSAYNNGEITPPHIEGYEKLTLNSDGIFAWYAKTERGVIGIVRVSWKYKGKLNENDPNYNKFDDAYYIIEYGSDECKAIDRDALLEMFGEYEAIYIFEGEYDEYGKKDVRIPELL